MVGTSGSSGKLAHRIQCICERLELSKGQMANLLGVSVMSIWRWENGKSSPLPAFMRALEDLEKKSAKMAAKCKSSKTTMKA